MYLIFGFLYDLRFACRQLRYHPGFSALAILVLTLGIGSTAAVFSVLYESLLKPLPYPEAQGLVMVHNAFPKGQVALTGVREVTDLTPCVRTILGGVDPSAPLFNVASMDERIHKSLAVREFLALLLDAFAGTGLFLAALGIHGSLAHAVALKRREIGIRITLGAITRDVIALTAFRSSLVLATGILLGLAGAFSIGRLIQSELYNVQAQDFSNWFTALTIMTIAAAAGALLPLRRALHTDPIAALREE